MTGAQQWWSVRWSCWERQAVEPDEDDDDDDDAWRY